MAWTVGASCVLYLVRVTGWLGYFSGGGGRALHRIVKKTCFIVHVRIYAYVMLLFYVLRVFFGNLYAVKFLCYHRQ